VGRIFTSSYYRTAGNLYDVIDLLAVLLTWLLGHTATKKVWLLFRLSYVFKHFDKISRLRVIFSGMSNGLLSIVCVLLVTSLVTYIYSIFGMILFEKNDPHHFGTLAYSMLSLIRCATLEDWSDLFYIAYYGCAVYDGGRYKMQGTNLEAGQSLCEPNAQPGMAIVYFFSYVIFVGYVMLSMFIGAISIAMHEQNDKLHRQLEVAKLEKFQERARKETDKRVALNKLSIDEQNIRIQLKNCLQKAFYGKDAEFTEEIEHDDAMMRLYLRASKMCRTIQKHPYFNGAMAAVICVLGLCSGLEMDPSWNHKLAFKMFSTNFTGVAIFILWVVGCMPVSPSSYL
jgi:hypothetical protein